MKILLYSKAFHPMVGGIETVSATMAEMFTKLGHECAVLTSVENDEADGFAYAVHRNPGFAQKMKLIKEADVVLSNGASLSLIPYCLLFAKPFVWIHAGYQASCVDGLGWVDGKLAPLTPKASLAFHRRKSGWLYAAKAAVKLYVRRFACRQLVTMNVTVSDWVARRQPFKKQVRIHNPFPLERFSRAPQLTKPKYDFVYVGRLVSEKGVDTLIKALAELIKQIPDQSPNLLIIGDGDWRSRLEALAKETGVEANAIFAGRQTGDELVEMIGHAKIAVVPSQWEEPMGGVALELLAAGKPLIVSRNGGLAECAGEAALTFDNGDHRQLADCMARLLKDETLRATLQENAVEQLKKFEPELLAKQYLDLFHQILGGQKETTAEKRPARTIT